MKLSQLDFLQTGAIGALRLGMEIGEIEAILGAASDTGNVSRRNRNPGIYVYGSVELFVRQTKPYECFAIYWYARRGELRLNDATAATDVILNPGMSVVAVEQALKTASVGFAFEENTPSATLVLNSGVKIVFDENGELYSVSSWRLR